MSSRLPAEVESDLDQVLSFLSSIRALEPTVPQATRAIAKRIHLCTYSLILWRFSLVKLSPHSKPFIDEIASDAIQILPHILLGYSKSARLLTRGVLENALRFTYFQDHPVEFEIMNLEAKWYMGIDKLVDYCKSHPTFSRVEKRFDSINRITSLYSELSASVHGRRVTDLHMHKALAELRFDPVLAGKDADLIKRCTEAVNFMIAIQKRTEMKGFSLDTRRVILRTLPSSAREIWATFE